MSGALPVVHGRRQGRPHLRFHHGREPAGFLLPHVLVRAQRRQPERGCAGGLHGESSGKNPVCQFIPTILPHLPPALLPLSAPLPEMFGCEATQLGLLLADPTGRLRGSPGQEGGTESAGQLQELQVGLPVAVRRPAVRQTHAAFTTDPRPSHFPLRSQSLPPTCRFTSTQRGLVCWSRSGKDRFFFFISSMNVAYGCNPFYMQTC